MAAPTITGDFPKVVRLLLGGFVFSRAAGFAHVFLGFHVAERSHGSALAGAVLAVFGVGALLGQVACGWLADRLGQRTTIAIAMLLGTAALFMLAEAETGLQLLAGAAVLGFTYDAPRPAISAAICELIPDPARRARADAWRFGGSNFGVVIAGGVGGMLADTVGTPILFVINGFAYAVFAGVVLCCIPPGGRRADGSKRLSYRRALSDKRLTLLAAASAATMTGVVGLTITVPLLMHYRGLDVGDYGMATMANTVTVVVLTPFMTPWLSRRVADGPRLDILAATGVWITACMALLAFAHSTQTFCVMVALSAPGEIAWFVVATGIVHRIAPTDQRGRYHGVWGSSFAVAGVVAPILASNSLAHGGPMLVFAASVAVGLVGPMLCLPLSHVLNPQHSSRREHCR